ncbi:hypothetical protein AQ914_04545 [Burkholderia pseudomallei]|nr:hypothetical protein AQ914_04545 [Burkholderia pseudomallei]
MRRVVHTDGDERQALPIEHGFECFALLPEGGYTNGVFRGRFEQRLAVPFRAVLCRVQHYHAVARRQYVVACGGMCKQCAQGGHFLLLQMLLYLPPCEAGQTGAEHEYGTDLRCEPETAAHPLPLMRVFVLLAEFRIARNERFWGARVTLYIVTPTVASTLDGKCNIAVAKNSIEPT